ncbi:MAG: hypothetical protein AAGC64_00685 [Bacteroidota bacterium]
MANQIKKKVLDLIPKRPSIFSGPLSPNKRNTRDRMGIEVNVVISVIFIHSGRNFKKKPRKYRGKKIG